MARVRRCIGLNGLTAVSVTIAPQHQGLRGSLVEFIDTARQFRRILVLQMGDATGTLVGNPLWTNGYAPSNRLALALSI